MHFSPEEGHNVIVVVLDGKVTLNGDLCLEGAAQARLSRDGGGFTVEAETDAKLLILAGAPIDEPVVAYGPFVMNSEAEIRQAITDFNSGRFGQL